MSEKEKRNSDKEEIFNPEKLDCCIEIGNCELENPPKELIEKLIGKPISQCEQIIKEFLKPKEKIVIKFPRKVGYTIQNDNR
jgi:hypothetical protein